MSDNLKFVIAEGGLRDVGPGPACQHGRQELRRADLLRRGRSRRAQVKKRKQHALYPTTI